MALNGPLLQEQVVDVGEADDQVVALAFEAQHARGVDVAAGEGVGDAEDGGQLAHRDAALAGQRHVLQVRRLRPAAAMIAGRVRRQHRLVAVEPEDLRIRDEVVAVLVVAAVAHVAAHLVEQGRHVQQEPLPGAEAVIGPQLVEQLQGHVGHRLGVPQVDVVLLGDRRGRVDHAGHQRPVLLARDPAGKLQQQPVAHRGAGDDEVRGLGEVEQGLINEQRGVDGLGLGEGDAEPLGQLLGGPLLAPRDQAVEVPRLDAVQVGRVGRLADLGRGETDVAAHRDERLDVPQRHRVLQ